MAPVLDEATVRHVAHLARLEITDNEVALFANQLSKVLGYIAQLDELDTKDVPPTAHPLPLSNVFREDNVQPGLESDQALLNAPRRQGAFFHVPKVLDQQSP